MNKQGPVKIGLIGLGKMGQNHLRVLSMLKSVDLGFIYDVNTDVMRESAGRYGVKPSENLEADLKNVEAVFIVTPTTTHYDMIRRAGQCVKNIFVEKPLTESVETTESICRFAAENTINLQVGFIERFNPAIVELKKILQHNSPRVINIDFIRTNKLSNRITDVDVIIDLMIHDIDLALYLNGEVKEVSVHGVMEEDLIVFAHSILTHTNGAFSSITASRVTEKRIRQINVTCDNMFIDCNLLRKELLVNRQTVNQLYRGVFLSSIEETISVSSQEALLSEDSCFVDTIVSGGRNQEAANALDSSSAIKVAQRVQTSIKEKYAASR